MKDLKTEWFLNNKLIPMLYIINGNQHVETDKTQWIERNQTFVYFQMAAENIKELIEKAQQFLSENSFQRARATINDAIDLVNEEKDKFLGGLNPNISEQDLADWYGGCSFIYSQVSI